MMNFKSVVQSAMLAAAMFLGASPAIAGPVYHVNLNTTTLAAEGSGLIDFTFMGLSSAEVSTVKLSNVSGAFGAVLGEQGVTATATGFNLSNSIDGLAWLTRAVRMRESGQ